MIELPEARTIAKDLRSVILGKRIIKINKGHVSHKFTFFNDDINQGMKDIINKKVTAIINRNFYIEIEVEEYKILFRDGANIRYILNEKDIPNNYQLLINFDDNSYLYVTVSMYAFINVSKTKEINNPFYKLELAGISPISKEFTYDYFLSLLNEKTSKLSSKAFIATEQRMLGVGNGISQDILYNANIHPKRKMNTLNDLELKTLYNSIIKTINEMTELRGRNTEKDIFGNPGNYQVKLSKKTLDVPCLKCNGIIKKENFLGGSIYFCSNCQKM